jgi:OHCU decarboxylase
MSVEPIDMLNRLPRDQFGQALRPLFEVAPPLAEGLYAVRPFASYPALIDAAESLTASLPESDQVRVLSAHPRIGANPATLSAASFREQGHTAYGAPDLAQVDAQLAELNTLYEQRFGFRFVVFVNGRPRSEILDVLRGRLANSREDELHTGLREMFRIARDRASRSMAACPTTTRPD